MEKNELFRIVDPETNMERVISFDSLAEMFCFHRDGEIQPTASFEPSPEGVKEIVRVFEETHSGKELLPKDVLRNLDEILNRFIRDKHWKNIQKLREIIEELGELQKGALRIEPQRTALSIPA